MNSLDAFQLISTVCVGDVVCPPVDVVAVRRPVDVVVVRRPVDVVVVRQSVDVVVVVRRSVDAVNVVGVAPAVT